MRKSLEAALYAPTAAAQAARQMQVGIRAVVMRVKGSIIRVRVRISVRAGIRVRVGIRDEAAQ